jgi:hypothetical protein
MVPGEGEETGAHGVRNPWSWQLERAQIPAKVRRAIALIDA